jgi:hypothetical protein
MLKIAILRDVKNTHETPATPLLHIADVEKK